MCTYSVFQVLVPLISALCDYAKLPRTYRVANIPGVKYWVSSDLRQSVYRLLFPVPSAHTASVNRLLWEAHLAIAHLLVCFRQVTCFLFSVNIIVPA